uniref:rRNA adenine N(6)-methyltransferase n=1 Tax=Meloidogyne incognita TaxID=6306 RepID=A0A914NAD8_MELIC
MASSALKVFGETSTYLPPLPALRDFIKIYRLNADRALSQNYLMDMNLCRKMVRCAGDLKNCHVIEVGPGPGGITRAILEKPCLRLDVVELDRQFIPALEHLKHHAQDRMFIHRGDIMQTDVGGIWEEAAATKCDWMDQNPPFSLIGNLPFHISTPLIIKLMRSISNRTGPFAFGRVPMMFSFQLEVAKRMVAPLGSDFRSRIGLTCQNWAEPKIMFDIPGKCFTPQPEVSVAFVRLTPRLEPQIPVAFEVSNKVFRVLFHLRRKYLRKVVRLLYPEPMLDDMADDLLRHCRLDPTMVVPMLDMQNFAEMCLFYEKQCREMPGLFLYDHREPVEMAELAKHPFPFPPVYRRPVDALERIENKGLNLNEFDAAFKETKFWRSKKEQQNKEKEERRRQDLENQNNQVNYNENI